MINYLMNGINKMLKNLTITISSSVVYIYSRDVQGELDQKTPYHRDERGLNV